MIEAQDGDTNIAAVASLFADPTRAEFLIALCDGRSLPAGELARIARVAPSTASSHLAQLAEGGLLSVESWGRHRYFRIADPGVVRAIEALAPLAPATPVRSLRQSQAAEAVRFARTCYDHLAGFLGVRFTQSLVERRILAETDDGYEVTPEGAEFLRDFGVEPRVRFTPRHVDWSERRHHFAGPLAKAVTARLFELGWIVRLPKGRAVRLTRAGRKGLREKFGLSLSGVEGRAQDL